MFTVILLSERAKPSFENWSTVFAPFVESGGIAFCEWNQSVTARSLAKAVPGLAEAIVGKPDWRVVVVDWAAGIEDTRDLADPENPFDFVDNIAADEAGSRALEALSLRDSPHPIVRLTHMLLGYPEIGSKAFEPDPSYWSKEDGRRVYSSEFVRDAESRGMGREEALEAFRRDFLLGNDAQVHYREVEYSEAELVQYREISRRYRVRQSRPNEVILLSTREPVELNPNVAVRRAWHSNANDQGPTRFVERNEYPPSCRFGVYDLRPRDHAAYQTDELEFWLSVLSLAANDLPPSSFQGDRLYRLGVDTDDVAMGKLLNAHLAKMAAAREFMDARIRHPRDVSSKPLSEFLPPQNVPVDFEAIGGDDLVVPSNGYGLASDVPRSEQSRWQGSYADLVQHTEVFMRGPRRALGKSVKDARRQAQSYLRRGLEAGSEPGPEDIDFLREEVAKQGRYVSETASPDILNRAKLQAMLQDNDLKIRRAINERMRMGTIAAAFAVVLLAWAAGFVPYLLHAGFIGKMEFYQSLAVALAFIVGVALIGLVVLVVMKWMLLRRIRRFNKDLRTFVSGVKAGAAAFGAYLSGLATYMHRKSVLISAEKDVARAERTRRAFRRKYEQIVMRIEREKAIVQRLDGVDVDFSLDRNSLRDVRMDTDAGFRSIFNWDTGTGTAEMNTSGETVRAPYDFITRVVLERVHVREKVREDLDPDLLESVASSGNSASVKP